MATPLPDIIRIIQRLSIKDAAEFLNVSTKTLRRWEQQGILIPERTVGNQRRYSLIQLQEFNPAQKRQLANQHFTEVKSQVAPILDQLHKDQIQNQALETPVSRSALPFSPKIRYLFSFIGVILIIILVNSLRSSISFFKSAISSTYLKSLSSQQTGFSQVLASETMSENYLFSVNIPTLFQENATVSADLNVEGQRLILLSV